MSDEKEINFVIDDSFLVSSREKRRQEKLNIIALILQDFIPVNTPERCGRRFDFLYDKTIEELRTYYKIYKQS